MRRTAFAASLFAAIALSTPTVALADIADVVVRGGSLDATRLEGLLRLELGPGRDIARVVVDVNEGRAAIELRLRDGRTLSGAVDLHDTRDQERAVALEVGELSREFDVMPPTSTPTEPDPSAATATATTTVSTPPSAPRLAVTTETETSRPLTKTRAYVLGGAAARLLTSGGALVAGPYVEAGFSLRERIRVGLIGRYGVASAEDSLGQLHAQTASAGATAAHRLVATPDFAVETGPRLDIGWIGGRGEGGEGGEGATSNSTSGLGIAGAWALQSRLLVVPPFALAASIEAGWLLPGLDLRADDRTLLRISGPFVGAALGVGFAP